LGEAPPVKEETVKNSEFGLKSTWFDNRLRLNLSMYQYDYTNLQQLELVGQPIPTYNLRNVDAKGNGYDVETVWQATEDLIFTMNYGFTDTEYTKWQFFDIETQTGTGVSKVGEPISGMPEDQANVRMDYYFEGLDGQWNLHISYAYTGDRTQGVDGPALAVMPFEQGSVTGLNDDELNSISAYGLLNTRLSWESDNHPIFAAVYVTNATDEQYIMQTGGQAMAVGSPIATPGMPRMWGIEFGMTF
jgi:iron complex outermembrane receptor protein